MLSSLTIAVLSCLIVVASGQATSMIPLAYSGYAFHRGNTSSRTTVEYFIDLTCSACLDSWPTLSKVYDTYKEHVHFMYRVFPLPYHQQAFVVSKAAQVVFAAGNQDAVFTFMDTAFANQAEIYNSATADMTYNQVVDLVSTWAVDGTGVTTEQYTQLMNSSDHLGSQIEMTTRYMWKYVAIQGVLGTPMFNIDGLKVGGLDTFEDWAAALDPLVREDGPYKNN